MAKIWYSVLGDGMGHAVRSNVVIEHLLEKNHDLMITAEGVAYPYFKEKYKDIVHKIEGESFVYKDNKVLVGKSIKNFFKYLVPKSYKNLRTIPRLLKNFKPDLCISDFEPASHYFSLFLDIPCISIDNVHTITECHIKTPSDSKYGAKSAGVLIKALHPYSDYYVLPAFADVKPKNPRKTFIVDPIILEDVFELKPEQEDFALVYQTTPTNTKMLGKLNKSGKKFIIYGMNPSNKYKNLVFKERNRKTFLEDLRKSNYVIINGGFTVISEALYLKKPILSIPILNQFEQEFNGYSLKERGYGDYTLDFSSYNLEEFESRIPYFKKNISKIRAWNNNKLFDTTDSLIKKCLKRKPNYKLLEKILKDEKKEA